MQLDTVVYASEEVSMLDGTWRRATLKHHIYIGRDPIHRNHDLVRLFFFGAAHVRKRDYPWLNRLKRAGKYVPPKPRRPATAVPLSLAPIAGLPDGASESLLFEQQQGQKKKTPEAGGDLSLSVSAVQ